MPVSGNASQTRLPPLRIGLYGPYHSRNLGDTATQIAVMANLRQRYPAVEFLGICLDPPDAARTHHIPTVDITGNDPQIVTADAPSRREQKTPIWRRLVPSRFAEWPERLLCVFRIARLAGKVDLLVVSGGGQIDDFWGGPWGRPFELLAWTFMCRLRGRKVAAFGTGLDNLTTRLGTRMAFRAMRLAHYRMFRDAETQQALDAAGYRMQSRVGPDPAFSLDVGFLPPRAARATDRRIVVVCPISESAWKHQADQSYRNYRDVLVQACQTMMRNGIQIHLSNSQSGMDVPVTHEVSETLIKAAEPGMPLPILKPVATVQAFCTIAAEADLVIASRLHGVILPMVVGTPVIGISYMRKVTLMMQDAGLPEQCIELDALSAERLTELTSGTLDKAADVRKHLQAINEKFRAGLATSYEELLAVGANRPALAESAPGASRGFHNGARE